MSLRRRVFLYLMCAAMASCTLATALGVLLVRHRLIVQRTAALVAQAELTASNDPAPGTRVYAVAAGRAVLVRRPARVRAVLAVLPASTSGQGTITVAGRALLYVARPSAFGRVVLIRRAAIAFAEWRPFLVSLVIALAGGALLAALLALALARRLSRPVAELAVATHRLAAGAGGVRVPAEGEDELAELGHSFNRMSLELERARLAQRRFFESVSHELRTPLTSIRGYAEALAEGAVGPQESARVIVAEAGRLERLVADLLELARLGREGFAVQSRRLDLGELAVRAVQRHGPEAARLGIALEPDCVEGGFALGDEDRLLQVISNLIENALRLTPPGGRVEVRCAPGQVSVRDGGPGLSPEDLPRAFERFYLYDRYRSERPVGSGLGLAIVQELTHAMGGEVHAQSPAGGGAEFVVTLPTQARSATPDAARPSA